jgi:serine protease AprX
VVFRMRWMVGLALAVLGATLPVALSSSNAELALPSLDRAPAMAALQPSVTPALATLAERAPSRRVEVIVQLTQGTKRAQASSAVSSLGGRVTRDLHIINAVVASMPAAGARDLAARPGVRAVSLNGAARPQYAGDTLATSFNASIQSREVWGYATGKGVGVAVVDTGIAGDLPDFRVSSGDRSSRVIGSAVVHPDATTATDRFGHGTHVAGIIAGDSQGRSSDDRLRGRYRGVAPDANLISIKASDDAGNSTVLDVIYGIQFAVDNKDRFGIRVVNLSLSSTVAESYVTDPLDAAAESAWLSGLVVVAAAGNDGIAPDAVSYAPGNDPYVISVGGMDDRGTKSRDDDILAPWSSRGVTQDGVRKPDVLAPGLRLVSTLAIGSDFEKLCRKCIVGRAYFRLSGTSMSTAVVSGVAALMLEKRPGLTPNQVKGAMASTLYNVPGAGAAVDALAALDGSGTANQGLTPNNLIDPATGQIDWTRASFRRASFRDALGSPLGAIWSRASFRCDCGLTASGEVDPTRVSFRRVSFRRTADFDR